MKNILFWTLGKRACNKNIFLLIRISWYFSGIYIDVKIVKPPKTAFQCLGEHAHGKHLVLDTGKKDL